MEGEIGNYLIWIEPKNWQKYAMILDGTIIIKQKLFFLILTSVCPLASPLKLPWIWVWVKHLQKQSLNLFFQDLDMPVKYWNNRKGKRLEHLIWFTCVVIIPYLALLHIISLPPNVWPIMGMLRLQKCCGQWYS